MNMAGQCNGKIMRARFTHLIGACRPRGIYGHQLSVTLLFTKVTATYMKVGCQ